MAKSKKERRSSIRHMPAEGDALAILDALDRAIQEEKPADAAASIDGDDADDDGDRER